MKLKQRMLPLLLVVALLASALPVGALAAKSPEEAEENALTAKWVSAPDTQEEAILAETVSGTVEEWDLQNEEPLFAPEGSAYGPDDLVDVIVVLEDAPLLTEASGSLQAYAESAAGQRREQELLAQHDALRGKLANLTGQAEIASIGGKVHSFDYTTVLNGFSARMPYGDIEAAMELDGVSRIFVAATYELPENLAGEEALVPMMDSSSGMISAGFAHDLGYDGSGSVVAILDSGLDTRHEAFQTMPETVKYTEEAIGNLLKGKLSCGITDASQVYVNAKVPFAYDYADQDNDVIGDQSHGTHVAGTVAGDCENLQGIAPKAQLLIMKVFADGTGSTNDSLILAGLDDAVKLGADTINMSLGSPSGFSYYWDETYSSIYNTVEEAGINLLVAAGNEDSSSAHNVFGNDHPLASEPDSAMVAAPSTYPASLSVASVENVAYDSAYFLVGEQRFAYGNVIEYNTKKERNILDVLDGKTVAYVPVPNFGAAADFEGLDLTGKLALISRGGGISFGEKLANASQAGAIAAIIYDNVPGAMGSMAVENYTIPAAFVTKASGEKLLSAETKEASFSKDYYGKSPSPVANQMSSFSSWGPGNELTIKPEITAPGGNIYSSVIGGGYAVSSGTSMATPHMAAAAALVRQYLQGKLGLSGKELGELANTLMMGTAKVAMDDNTGLPFSPRRQGAGVVDLEKAMTAEAYVTVDGCNRPKAEVGSSEVGRYQFDLTVHSWADHERTYSLRTDVCTEAIVEQSGLYFAAEEEQDLSQYVSVSYEGLTQNLLVVPAGGVAKVTVTVILTDAGKAYLESYFKNGCYIEGFTYLVAEDETGVSLNVPFLGFYGDWDNLDAVEDFKDGVYNVAPTMFMNINDSRRGYYMGLNTYSNNIDYGKLSFSNVVNGNDRKLIAQASLLRNCKHLDAKVTDSNGNIVWSWDFGDEFRKSFYYASYGSVLTTTLEKGWDGRMPESGDRAPEGWYTYTLSALPCGGNAQVQDSDFRFYLDSTSPVVSNPQVYLKDGKTYLSVEVFDNHYVQYLLLCDSAHNYYFRVAAEEFDAIREMGTTSTVLFDITGLAMDLSESGRNPGRLCLQVGDYANNISYTFIDIGPQNMSIEGASLEIGEEKQLSVTILPERMAGEDLTWASSDESIFTVTQEGVVKGISAGAATVSVSVKSGYTAYATIEVGMSNNPSRDSRTFGDCEELNEIFSYESLLYKVSGPGTLVLLGRDKTLETKPTDIVIPSVISYKDKSWSVTTIGVKAFYMDKSLKSVVIPNSVKTVGRSAFYYCSNITSITIPDSIEYVCNHAFSGMSKAADIRIPANLKYIGTSGFRKSLLKAAILPDTLLEIGDEAFALCDSLIEATIPASVQTYGKGIFMEDGSLQYVELPYGLTEIPKNMFYACLSLRSIQIPYGVTTICEGAFSKSGLQRLSLPNTVTTIERFAYAQLSNMREIVIPESITTIGNEAFSYSRNVTSITIGSNVSRIGNDAFYMWHLDDGGAWQDGAVPEVKSLQAGVALRRSGYTGKITLNGMPFHAYSGTTFQVENLVYRLISDTEVSVAQYVPSAQTSDVVVPATVTCEGDGQTYTVTEIEDRVFNYREDMERLALPDTIKVAHANSAGYIIYGLNVNVPTSLETVNDFAFANIGADYILAHEWTGDPWEVDTLIIPGSLRNWGISTFSGYPSKNLVVEEGITRLGHSAFAGMEFMESAKLPTTLKRMDDQSMRMCYKLNELVLPDGLEYIGNEALAGTPITNVVVPSSVAFIGDSAFNGSILDPELGVYLYSGPETVRLSGGLEFLGFDSINEAAQAIVVLNSQRNMVVERNTVSKMPQVVWDGKTNIPFNDGSCIPEGETVTVTNDVTIDGKLCIEGKLVVAPNVNLIVTENARIEGAENIEYKTCDGGEGCYSKTFTDLNTNSWYHAYTDYVIACGLMKGVSDTKFAPNTNLTRGMLVTTLYRLAGQPEVTEAASFTDVAENQYYTDAIAWAEDVGIAQGMGEGKFAPNGAVTREQGMTFLYRYVVKATATAPWAPRILSPGPRWPSS